MSHGISTRAHLAQLTILPLIFLLAVVSVFLVRENFRLRTELSDYQSLQHTAVGVPLPSIHGTGLDGREVTIPSAGSQETLLFFFSPQCGYCKRSWGAWAEIAKASPNRRIAFVNVGGAITSAFLETYPVAQWALVAKADPASVLAYRIRETPVTVLVNRKGISAQVWEGDISASRLDTIKGALAIR